METVRIESPFVGLVPYTESDAQFFFGREKEQRIIISNLFAARLTILYGSSGVGKSSVLRAGVIRELHQRIERAKAEGQEPDLAVVYYNDWKIDPLAGLALAIRNAMCRGNGSSTLSASPPPSLQGVIERTLGGFEGDLMIILDQFEEYFLYQPREVLPGTFAHEFAHTANNPNLPVRFLISLREDALAKLDRFKSVLPNLFANYLRLGYLGWEEARDAVLMPVEAYNRLPAGNRKYPGHIAVEPAMADALLDQVRKDRVLLGEVGRGVTGTPAIGIETPYLQLVLTRIWSEELESGSNLLRLETLNRLGGAAKIVEFHLEGVMNRLTEEERELCARMFQYLVTPGGAKIAHTTQDLSEFAKTSPEHLLPILEKLSGSGMRILAPVASVVGQEMPRQYEIYHDSLAHAVLDWRKRYVARRELEDQEKAFAAEAARQRHELEQAQALASAQREKAKQEARSAAILRRLLVACGALFLMAVLTASLAWYLRGLANENARLAKDREAMANENAVIAKNSEARMRISESLAKNYALEAQQERERAAEAAHRLALALGEKQQAEKFRKLAEDAKTQALMLEQKGTRDVNAVLQAQEEARAAIRERDAIADKLRAAERDILTLKEKQSSQTPGQPSRPLSPVPLMMELILSEIYIIHDGSPGESEWSFTVSANKQKILLLPPARFSDDAQQPRTLKRPTRFAGNEGETVDIQVNGTRMEFSAEGHYGFVVPPQSQWTRGEMIRIPVVVWKDPKKGAFVFTIQLLPHPPR